MGKFWFQTVFALCAACAAVLLPAGRAFAEEGMTAINDTDLAAFSVQTGSASAGAGGSGVVLAGSAGQGFSCSYNRPVQGGLKVSLNLESVPYDAASRKYAGKIHLLLKSDPGAKQYLRATVTPKTSGAEVTLALAEGGGEIVRHTVAALYEDIYTGSGARSNLQLYFGEDQKLAIDVEGAQDGSLITYDVFRANCSGLEGKELKAGTAIGDFYRSLKAGPAYLSVEADPLEAEGLGGDYCVRLMQVGGDNFYDYYEVPSAVLNGENAVSYSKVAIRWEVKAYAALDYNGYLISRYRAGETVSEKTVKLASKLSSTLNDTRLAQGQEYVYEVSAYRDLDKPVPKLALLYRGLSVTTHSGSMSVFLTVLAAALALFVLLVLVYVNWYDIKARFAQRKNNKPMSR